MTSPYPIRPVSEAEFPEFYVVVDHAFNATYPTEPEQDHDLLIFEFDRTLAAFDGSDMVGTTCVFSMQMSVPGGMIPVAGVSGVAVLPSHRRRGILSSLMHQQLSDIRDRGEAVAALFASEAAIYGRFGYGVATLQLDLMIHRGDGRVPVTAPGAGVWRDRPGAPRLRLADPQDARAELAAVFAAAVPARPGMPVRDERWWDFWLWDPEHRRDGFSKETCVIAEDETGPRGYALYCAKPDYDEYGIPNGELRVREMVANDPAAAAAIWNDLLGRDLIARVRARMRPADEPLLHLLPDLRRARPRIADGMWIRLVSVPEALAQRCYACPVDVVVEVTDDILAENQGRWRLRAPGLAASPAGSQADSPAGSPADAGATCERTSDPADLALPVQALGAAYLGGTRLGSLAAAGRVAELRPGALAELSAAMSWDPAPWCPTDF
jgi:predicted acetyltransferase